MSKIEAICLECARSLEGHVVCYGLHEDCFVKKFSIPKGEDFWELTRQSAVSRDPLAQRNSDYRNNSFFHGKYRKYSAQLGEQHYILKVCDKEAPDLPEVEYLSNQIARAMGVEVPHFALINFHGERTFVTENFVKKIRSGADLRHIYRYMQEDDELCCETLISLIERETGKFVDIERFVHVLLFDSLIGNHDRHGRNLALLITSQEVRLSPIYDNPSGLGLEPESFLEAHLDPKGKVFTRKSKEPTTKDYVEEFIRLGYSDSIRVFFKKFKTEKIVSLVESSHCSLKMKEAFLRLFRRRYAEVPSEFLPKRN